VLRPIQVPGGKRMVQAASLDRLISGHPAGFVALSRDNTSA
jgi:hypothetical protein